MRNSWEKLRAKRLRGKFSKMFDRWIHDKIKVEGNNASFTLNEIMLAHSLNYNDRTDYHHASEYFMTHRKLIEVAMEDFWCSDKYKELMSEGLQEERIFEELIKHAIEYEIFPMWADPAGEHRYFLFNLESYLQLKERRAHAIITEIERKSDEMKIAQKGMPKILERYVKIKPLLKETPEVIGISERITRDEEKGKINCPYRGCRKICESDEKLVKHIEKYHTDVKREYICPNCQIGKLATMPLGDYICKECKSQFLKEDIEK